MLLGNSKAWDYFQPLDWWRPWHTILLSCKVSESWFKVGASAHSWVSSAQRK